MFIADATGVYLLRRCGVATRATVKFICTGSGVATRATVKFICTGSRWGCSAGRC